MEWLKGGKSDKVDEADKTLAVCVRHFNDKVQEQDSRVLAKLPPNITVGELTGMALVSFGFAAADADKYRLLNVFNGGRHCEILGNTKARILPMLTASSSNQFYNSYAEKAAKLLNPLYHCFRLEKIEDTTAATLALCYHAERHGTGANNFPFGHPFYLPIYPDDTVPKIKERMIKKLVVDEREFKHWRFSKVIEGEEGQQGRGGRFANGGAGNNAFTIDHSMRNMQMMRDEDDPKELQQYFFEDTSGINEAGKLGVNAAANAQDGDGDADMDNKANPKSPGSGSTGAGSRGGSPGGANNAEGAAGLNGKFRIKKIACEHQRPPLKVQNYGEAGGHKKKQRAAGGGVMIK